MSFGFLYCVTLLYCYYFSRSIYNSFSGWRIRLDTMKIRAYWFGVCVWIAQPEFTPGFCIAMQSFIQCIGM